MTAELGKQFDLYMSDLYLSNITWETPEPICFSLAKGLNPGLTTCNPKYYILDHNDLRKKKKKKKELREG